MSVVLLTILKYALIVVIWIFFAFALRAVWRETRRAQRTPASVSARPVVASAGSSAQAEAHQNAARVTPTGGPKTGALVVLAVAGPLEGRRLELATPATIGRDASCDLTLADDRFVSGHHAEVVKEGRRIIVRDLGSTNGTFVNGERVEGSMRVTRGDVLQVGQSAFRVVG